MAAVYEEEKVLGFIEAETIIKNIKITNLSDIGSKEWQRSHEYFEKINFQALLSASNQGDEYINELFNTHNKLEDVVEHLILTEVWKNKVFPIILKTDFQPTSTIPMYMVIYHEVTLVNLLETLLYHQESVESIDEVCLDLLDYCYRKLVNATKVTKTNSMKQSCHLSSLGELQNQSENLDFEISVKCVSILRYIIAALDRLPLSVSTRMMKTLNIPCLLVQLIQNPPWVKKENNVITKYFDGKWNKVLGPEALTMTKTEAQPWLGLYILMTPKFSAKYSFNDFNKTQLLKLRAVLSDVVVDQLPVLIDLRTFLEQLAITTTPPPNSDLVLEQLPEIRERIISKNKEKFTAIAKHQMLKYFNPTQRQIKEQSKRLADTYDYDALDSLISEVPRCESCGNEASKRCSRCRRVWYCSRDCQVGHWKKHKSICDVFCLKFKEK